MVSWTRLQINYANCGGTLSDNFTVESDAPGIMPDELVPTLEEMIADPVIMKLARAARETGVEVVLRFSPFNDVNEEVP